VNPVDHNYLKYYQIKFGDLLLDVGASLGEWGEEILEKLTATGAFLICMEPAPWCLERLAKWINDRGHGYATILSAAIVPQGSEPVVDLGIADSHLTSHLATLGDQAKRWGGRVVRTDPVMGMSLDEVVEKFGFINLVKMDIESAEVPVLMGSSELVFNRVKNLSIAAYHEYEGKLTWEILLPFLESKGYKCIHECLPYKDFPAMDMLYATKDGSF